MANLSPLINISPRRSKEGKGIYDVLSSISQKLVDFKNKHLKKYKCVSITLTLKLRDHSFTNFYWTISWCLLHEQLIGPKC